MCVYVCVVVVVVGGGGGACLCDIDSESGRDSVCQSFFEED